jgi:plastocyanin
MNKTLRILSVLASLTFAVSAFATDWHASVGAESKDLGRQAIAFLPNEMWIHAGDSITFNFITAEIHTVTFLTSGQVRPPFQVGCPGFAAGSAIFDGTTCVTSPPLATGGSLTVSFPNAGNYKLTCLVRRHDRHDPCPRNNRHAALYAGRI